jgi:hypothetical protein
VKLAWRKPALNGMDAVTFAAAFAADPSEAAVNRLCRGCGDTCTISFLRSSSLLRFGVVREGQYRARARVSEFLVNASIEILDQFVEVSRAMSSF